MQVLLVIISIVAASAYLAYQAYHRMFKKHADCEGCAMSKAQKSPLSK